MSYQSNKILLQSEKSLKHRRIDYSRPLVAICYPNTYEVGMSNLAFHFMLRSFSSSNLRIERVFALPQAWKHKAATFESGEKLSKAAAVLATIAFEEDYANLVALLAAAGIPMDRLRRSENHPLIIAGGSAVSANPTVVAPYCDAVAVGEFDNSMDFLVDLIESAAAGMRSKEQTLDLLERSGNYFVLRDDMQFQEKYTVKMARTPGNYKPLGSEIISRFSHFPDTVLIELNRSCVSSCRFCMATHLYKPFRTADYSGVIELCDRWRGRASAVGFIGTALTSYPGFEALCENIRKMGFAVRLSSLRIEDLTEEKLKFIAGMGIKTITLAPESASDILRKKIGKRFSNVEMNELFHSLANIPFKKVKLYYMYGIPGESRDDLDLMIRSIAEARKIMRNKMVNVSINCLIPKAWTPFQWNPMPSREEIDAKRKYIISSCRRSLKFTPTLYSAAGIIYQAALSSGGSAIGKGLHICARSKGKVLQHWTDSGVKIDDIVHKEKTEDFVFPWDFVDTGIRKDKLYGEYVRAKRSGSD